MKKLSNVLLIIISALIALVALVFTILEARLVLSFDWALHEHEFLGFIQYLARLGLSLVALVITVCSIAYRKEITFVFESAALFSIAAGTLFFATNGFGIYFTILAALHLGASVFHKISSDKEITEETENITNM